MWVLGEGSEHTQQSLLGGLWLSGHSQGWTALEGSGSFEVRWVFGFFFFFLAKEEER